MFGNHGLCGLLKEGAHGKSPKCLGGNLGDFGKFCKGLRLPEKFGRFSGSLWYWAQQMQVQIRRCAVIARMPIQPKQTSVFGKRVFDGAKVVRRVEGNLWVFGMVALEKTCFKGQMPSENRFQTAFSIYSKQTEKGSNILQSSYSHKRFRTLRLHGSRTR